MMCPKCRLKNTSHISETHYVCNNPNCVDDNGNRTQFIFFVDANIKFPSNQIFADRQKNEFFRKPYLKIENDGVKI